MAPLTFEKPLCGPSLDMFTKDYAHENVWEVEHSDAEKRVNFTNNLKLAKNGSVLGFTHLKGDCGVVHAELKMQNAGTHHVEASIVTPGYTPLVLHSKYPFGPGQKADGLTVVAEHTLPYSTAQFKVVPMLGKYSTFSLLTYKANCWQLSCGAEVSGTKEALYTNHVIGMGYKNTHLGKTYMVSARLLGEPGAAVKSVIGNVYAATSRGYVSNAFTAAIEHKLDDASTKLKFGGIWHLSDGTNPNPSYVKAKCDSDGQVAVTFFQRFSEKLAAAVGLDFSAKADVNPANFKYGFKLLLS